MRGASLIAAALALCPAAALAQVAPYSSFRKLSSTNGWSPIVYDLEARRLVSFREHLYRYPAPNEETRELAYDLYLGLRVAGTSAWLTSRPLVEAGYERGTGLIRTVQEDRGIRVTTTYTAPFGLDAHAFLVIAELENIGADTTDVALFSIHNFHTGGGGEHTSLERIRWDSARGAYLESSSAPDAMPGVLVVKPITAATHHTASPQNPFPLVEQSQLFGDIQDSTPMTDAVSGFQFDVANRGTFARGAKVSFAIAVGLAPDEDFGALITAIDNFTGNQSPENILANIRAEWAAWHASALEPITTSPEEDLVAKTSLAILRMGQVREPGAPFGAAIASLPPGRWDICWVRDAMFAADAFTATGHHTEAENILDFVIRGPFGDYQTYVGRPYGLSLARYFGNAREESDSNANGPNIELDGFGMFLESAAGHVIAANRGAWLTANRAHVDPLIAGVLTEYRDAETNLVAADSSIWETHWDNGGRQRWTFTSGRAVRGLGDWANAIEATAGASDPRVAEFRTAAGEIHAAMITSLIDPTSGALAASVEQLRAGTSFADAQAALILRRDRFDPASATGLATLDFIRDRLFLSTTTRRGYKRNDDGDVYDRREWIVIDLGISRALREAGRTADADALLSWVTQEAALNFGLVPELLDENDARYAGEVPMVGFGAGAYLLAIIARSGTRAPQIMDAGVVEDAAPTPEDAEPAPDAELEPDAGIITLSDAATPDRDASSTHADAREGSPAGSSCACAELDRSPKQHALELFAIIVAGVLALRRRRV